jgi:uncharacterized membrane protein
VLAIDQIHRLLKAVGRRTLQCDQLADRTGRVRVIYRTPDWEDYVNVACTEIRACGAGQVQIARRMRAMLDNAVATLAPYRHAALVAEGARLDRAMQTLYTSPDDLALASIADTQGLGGSTASGTVRRLSS